MPTTLPVRRKAASFLARNFGFLALAALIGGALQYQYQLLPADLAGLARHGIEPTREAPRFFNPGPSITVVDGDTVYSGSTSYRLVGIDTPETGRNARCASERARGEAATRRLRQLVDAGDVRLERVACACRRGTEGTSQCNHGRLCGRLSAGGRDVAGILISEGLARPYHCGASGCPRRAGWCG